MHGVGLKKEKIYVYEFDAEKGVGRGMRYRSTLKNIVFFFFWQVGKIIWALF